MDEESAMAYVKEEIPLVPPQVVVYSLLFSTSNLQDPLHNSSQLPQKVDSVSDVEGCLVEEETPPAWHDERIMVTKFFKYASTCCRL
jgi:hypothetical protein